jgi:serine/threonine protein kinase
MDTVFKQRFEREIKVLSQLDHQNIVKIIQWTLRGILQTLSLIMLWNI